MDNYSKYVRKLYYIPLFYVNYILTYEKTLIFRTLPNLKDSE